MQLFEGVVQEPSSQVAEAAEGGEGSGREVKEGGTVARGSFKGFLRGSFKGEFLGTVARGSFKGRF